MKNKKKPNIFLIILGVIFFPITLVVLVIMFGGSSKSSKDLSEKSFLLGETDDPTNSYIDMTLMDDDE